MFAQLGNDEDAKTLIQHLDHHETLGKWVHCLPGELEYLDEISRQGKHAYWKVVNIPFPFRFVRPRCLPTDFLSKRSRNSCSALCSLK
jgi:hypothetical protein